MLPRNVQRKTISTGDRGSRRRSAGLAPASSRSTRTADLVALNDQS
jgi:hypothetical protein